MSDMEIADLRDFVQSLAVASRQQLSAIEASRIENEASRIEFREALDLQHRENEASRIEFREALDLQHRENEASRIEFREALEQAQARQDAIFAEVREVQNVDRAEFRAHVENTFQAITLLAQEGERHWQVTQGMLSEIRGLRTETRRILERLESRADEPGGE